MVRDCLYAYVREAVPLLMPLLELCRILQMWQNGEEPTPGDVEICGDLRRLPPVGLVLPESPPAAWMENSASFQVLVESTEAALEREVLRGFRSSLAFQGVDAWAQALAGDMVPAIFNDALRLNELMRFVRRAAPDSQRLLDMVMDLDRLRRKAGQKQAQLLQALIQNYLAPDAPCSLGPGFVAYIDALGPLESLGVDEGIGAGPLYRPDDETPRSLPPGLELLSKAVEAHIQSGIMLGFLLSPEYAALLEKQDENRLLLAQGDPGLGAEEPSFERESVYSNYAVPQEGFLMVPPEPKEVQEKEGDAAEDANAAATRRPTTQYGSLRDPNAVTNDLY